MNLILERGKLYKDIGNLSKNLKASNLSDKEFLALLSCLISSPIKFEHYLIIFSPLTGYDIDNPSCTTKRSSVRHLLKSLVSRGDLLENKKSGYQLSLAGKRRLQKEYAKRKEKDDLLLTADELKDLVSNIEPLASGEHASLEVTLLTKVIALVNDMDTVYPIKREVPFGYSGERGTDEVVKGNNTLLKADIAFEVGYPAMPVYLEGDRFTEPVVRIDSNGKSLLETVKQYMELHTARKEQGKAPGLLIFVGDGKNEVKADVDNPFDDIRFPYEYIARLLSLAARKSLDYKEALDLLSRMDEVLKGAKEKRANEKMKEVLSSLIRYSGDDGDLMDIDTDVTNLRTEFANVKDSQTRDIKSSLCDSRLLSLASQKNAALLPYKSQYANGQGVCFVSNLDFTDKMKLLLPEYFYSEGVRVFLGRLLGDTDLTAYSVSRPILFDGTSNMPILQLRNCYKVGDRVVAIEDLKDDIYGEDRLKEYLKYLGYDSKVLFVGIVGDNRQTYRCPALELISNHTHLSSSLLSGMDLCFVTAGEYLGRAPVKPFTVIDGKYCLKDLANEDMASGWSDDRIKYALQTNNEINQGGFSW